MKARKFVDTVIAYAYGGRGGNGCVSFRREKFVPRGGPDGGDGGRGGHVLLQANKDVDSLVPIFYSPHQRAGHGGHGKGKKLHGRNGRDLTVPVPCGTEVWNSESETLIRDLVEHGDEVTVAAGGDGGSGNCHWLTSTNRAPREHTDGEEGVTVTLRLLLKTVADVGLVGYPNAGKSSLLRRLSHAHPKVAAYPFTTLHPVVGTVMFEDYTSLKLADIPGLIDGAHDGVGLGHAFLRHIERSGALVFVIDMAGVDGRHPWDDYESLLNELHLHKQELVGKPSLLVANKMDLPESSENLPVFVERTGLQPLQVSASTDSGTEELKSRLKQLSADMKASEKADPDVEPPHPSGVVSDIL